MARFIALKYSFPFRYHSRVLYRFVECRLDSMRHLDFVGHSAVYSIDSQSVRHQFG